MKTTDIYNGGSHQMIHCDTCDMPSAHSEQDDSVALYSVTKHAIMETKAEWDNPEGLDYMRKRHQEQGTIAIFEAALRCIRCAEGICLLVDGNKTWSVGGEDAVG